MSLQHPKFPAAPTSKDWTSKADGFLITDRQEWPGWDFLQNGTASPDKDSK